MEGTVLALPWRFNVCSAGSVSLMMVSSDPNSMSWHWMRSMWLRRRRCEGIYVKRGRKWGSGGRRESEHKTTQERTVPGRL